MLALSIGIVGVLAVVALVLAVVAMNSAPPAPEIPLGFSRVGNKLVMTDDTTGISVEILPGGPSGSNNQALNSPALNLIQDNNPLGMTVWMQAWPPGTPGAGPNGDQTMVVVNSVTKDKPWLPQSSASSNYLGYLGMVAGAQAAPSS